MAAGIHERTFYTWKSKAELPDSPPEYRQFVQALTRAEQEGSAARIAMIQKAGRTDWRACAWLQERLDPKRWSLKHRVEHSGQIKRDDGAFELLRDPVLRKALEQAAQRRAEAKRAVDEHPRLAARGA